MIYILFSYGLAIRHVCAGRVKSEYVLAWPLLFVICVNIIGIVKLNCVSKLKPKGNKSLFQSKYHTLKVTSALLH